MEKKRKQTVDIELRLKEREIERGARGIACLTPRRCCFPLQTSNIAETKTLKIFVLLHQSSSLF